MDLIRVGRTITAVGRCFKGRDEETSGWHHRTEKIPYVHHIWSDDKNIVDNISPRMHCNNEYTKTRVVP